LTGAPYAPSIPRPLPPPRPPSRSHHRESLAAIKVSTTPHRIKLARPRRTAPPTTEAPARPGLLWLKANFGTPPVSSAAPGPVPVLTSAHRLVRRASAPHAPTPVPAPVLPPAPPSLGPPLPATTLARHAIQFSVISQLDSLLFSLLAVRLERDVLAQPGEISFNKLRGLKPFESCSSFVGLYWSHPLNMAAAVDMVSCHHGCGLFIFEKDQCAPSSARWALATVLLEFVLPRGMVAVMAAFDYKGKFKSKRRPERHFRLRSIDRVDSKPDRVLSDVPLQMSRASPLSSRPLASSDCSADQGPLSPALENTLLTFPRSNWAPPVFSRWAAGFPDETIKSIAVNAVTHGVDTGFVGDRSKTVIRKNSRSIRGHEELLREKLIDECLAGFMAGPFLVPPFRFCRSTPLSMVPKDKYDPASTRMRIISDFSAGGTSSVNELFFSPRLIGVHLRAFHLRDVISSKGPGCRAWAADVPNCFRQQRNIRDQLFLFVYHLTVPGGPLEWFVDLCNPFGSRPSEFSWQAILNIIMWEARRLGFWELLGYVDNLFRIYGYGEASDSTGITAMLSSVGLPLHEVQEGTSFYGLGWSWDLAGMLMVCPEDKHAFFSSFLNGLSSRVPLKLSLSEVRKVVGLMNWLSAAFEIGKADVASLIGVRTGLEAVAVRKSLRPDDVSAVLTGPAAESLLFWARVFPSWDRSCPIVGGFGPTRSWELLGRCDASTDWGAGGFLFDGSHVWLFARPWSDGDRGKAFVSNRESTGVFELMGASIWADLFACRCAGRRLLLELDSACAVQALARAYSPRTAMLSHIRRIRELAVEFCFCPRFSFILGVLNIIADNLSHGLVQEAVCAAELAFGVPAVVVSASHLSTR